MNLRGKIDFAEITDTGRVREHNEDAIGSVPEIGLMVLADGMGGYNAGEVASGIAVQIVTDLAAVGANREERDDIDPHSGMMRQSIVLRDAVYRANKIIYQTAQSQTHCEGMGTTIVACMYYDDRVSIAHVGDSRAYRLRDGQLEQITMDHSLLQELVDRGFYSEEEAQRSTNRNYVTRALGVEPVVEVEVHEHDVLPGDIYLLCSDGLPDMVEDDDIHLTISTFNASLEVV
ncbi:MAG: protein phosphatase 2C domain-containing protein, partial [Woeseiaceae bacterium]